LPTTSGTIVTPDTNGNFTVTGNVVMGSSFLRNRIINGDMVIDQRNAGALITLTSAAAIWVVDRTESYANTDGTVTAQRVTDAPTGFVNSLRHTTTVADSSLSANQRVQVVQKIEGFNVADFGLGTTNAVTFTVSFWVKSSLTGTFGGSIMNSGYTRAYPFNYTITSANTWERKTVTIPGDTSGTWLTNNGVGLILCFALGVGSSFSGTANTWQANEILAPTGSVSVVGTLNATWQVTGVQLELGTSATPFERRQFGTELQLCQRYFEKSFNLATAPSNGTSTTFSDTVGLNTWIATNRLGTGTNTYFKVTKRATPTITNFGNSAGHWAYIAPNGTAYIWSAGVAPLIVGENGFTVQQQVIDGAVAFVSGHWTASAEL
jgi:hypothetical protein